MHIIMSCHPGPFLCIHDSHFLHVHAIGATEEITVLEYEADPRMSIRKCSHMRPQVKASLMVNSCQSASIISPQPL